MRKTRRRKMKNSTLLVSAVALPTMMVVKRVSNESILNFPAVVAIVMAKHMVSHRGRRLRRVGNHDFLFSLFSPPFFSSCLFFIYIEKCNKIRLYKIQ